jgi:hypothetical protein
MGWRAHLAATAVLLTVSCTQVGNGWMLGTGASAATDQIMLVRKDPPSFGYQRMTLQADQYPDIRTFLGMHGLPDFLAETGNRDRRYFILYYLKGRQAFACRTFSLRGRAVEFAGPYPITHHEFKLLDGFRRAADRRLGKP